jgi:seryl-tRNA synthetase
MAKKEDVDILTELEEKLGQLETTEKNLKIKKKELKEIEDKIADTYSTQMEVAAEVEDLKKSIQSLKKEEKTLQDSIFKTHRGKR